MLAQVAEHEDAEEAGNGLAGGKGVLQAQGAWIQALVGAQTHEGAGDRVGKAADQLAGVAVIHRWLVSLVEAGNRRRRTGSGAA